MRAGFYRRTPACYRCIRWGTGDEDTVEAIKAVQAEIDRIIAATDRKAYTELDPDPIGSYHRLHIQQPTFVARHGGFVLETKRFDSPQSASPGNWVVIPYDLEEPIQVWPDERYRRNFQDATLKPDPVKTSASP